MTTADRDPMFDQRIADWLEGDPNNAPVTVLETLADTMPVTRQRRATLPLSRIGRVSAPLRLALVAAIVVALVGGAMLFAGRQSQTDVGPTHPPASANAVVPSAAPTPSVEPTPQSTSLLVDTTVAATLKDRFVSPKYGYSIAVDPSWVITPAALTWSGPDNSDLVVDAIDITGTDTTITVASEALEPGDTYTAWLNRFALHGLDLPTACNGGDPATYPPVQVGGTTGGWQQMCNAAEVVAENGGRAYAFTWGNGTFDTARHLSPEAYRGVLGTVRFEPTSAASLTPPPGLNGAFTSNTNAFTIHYPTTWRASKATKAWAPDVPIAWGDPELDQLENAGARFVGVSQPLKAGQTPEDWLIWLCHEYQAAYVDCDNAPAIWQPIAIGSSQGWIVTDGIAATNTVANGGRLFDAAIVVNGRGYEFTLDGLVERPLFDALLRSVTFPPG